MTIQDALDYFIRRKEQLGISDKIQQAETLAISAFEKQTSKKPDMWGDGYDDNGNLIYNTWACPCCRTEYELDYDDYKFCPNCGQAIDWNMEKQF